MPRLTARERREAYLREYGYQKKTGKPFFPYALLHDTAMNFFFVALMVLLAVVWYVTSGAGPDANHGGSNGWLGPRYEDRADPAVESYDPRPEWYFFFLFELLRIFKNPDLLLFGTIIIPTIWMLLLLGIPFIDRSRERRLSHRPIALSFASGMAVLLLALTWYGSAAPAIGGAASSPIGVAMENQQCTTCHTLSEAGWAASGPGPNLDSAHPNYARVKEAITNGLPGGMPAFKDQFTPAQIDCIADWISSVTNGGSDTSAGTGGAPKTAEQACGKNGEQLTK
jgi:quinol---cytochrome c reductase cytochrome c subunit, bacillus type